MKTPTATPNMRHQVTRSTLFALAMMMMIPTLVPTKAAAAACTWVAAGVPTDQNFSGPLNWDDPPSPAADLIFPAGSAFVAKGAPVNDLVGLDLNAIYLYEAYNLTGNTVDCQIIRSYNATISTVSLPVATVGAAVLTVRVDTAGATLYLRGLLSGPRPITFEGPGIKRLSGTINNTTSGLHIVASGNLVLDSTASESVAGPMVINSGAIAILMAAPEIKNTVSVTVDGHFDLSAATGDEGTDTETIGGLLGTGTINLGAKTLGCTAQPVPTVFAGSFTGTGGFRQSISGIQVLSGTSSHTGATTLAGGELHIRGSQTASPVIVTAGTLVLANDCLVGSVTLSGGAASTLSCYDTLAAVNLHGTATSLTVGNGCSFLVVSRGATATNYSNLTTAAVNINGATLIVDTSTYTPAVASEMTIIDNTGVAAVTGTFAGLPENALVVSSTDPAITFSISYVGGTGNDITLTRNLPDNTEPVITDLSSGTPAASSATITWTTDEASTSQVEYGLTTAYGSTTTIDANLLWSHGVPVTGLVASTVYHFRVLSRDASGNIATSTDGSFTTTAAADTTAPVISAVSVSGITISSATVTWTTNEAANGQVEYGLTTAYGSTTTLAAGMVLSHSVPVTGLAADTVYHFRVLSSDAAANLATGIDRTFTTSATADTTAPVISAVSSSSLAISSAAVTWTTDEVSNSKVEYGLTTAYGNVTSINPSLVLSHGISVTGLLASTVYHFRVYSRDASGNLAISTDHSFTTTATTDTTAPVISAVTADSLTVESAVITWTTDEASTSKVEYGLTAAYGSFTTTDANLVLSHSVPVNALEAATVYHFRVLSRDAAGNLATGGDGTFTTSAIGVSGGGGDDDGNGCGLGGAFALLALAAMLSLRLRAFKLGGKS